MTPDVLAVIQVPVIPVDPVEGVPGSDELVEIQPPGVIELQRLYDVVLRAARTQRWPTHNGLVRRRISSMELAACAAECVRRTKQDKVGKCRACSLDRGRCCWARDLGIAGNCSSSAWRLSVPTGCCLRR